MAWLSSFRCLGRRPWGRRLLLNSILNTGTVAVATEELSFTVVLDLEVVHMYG